MFALIPALFASPLLTSLVTLFGAPAAGSVLLIIMHSKTFLGLAGHIMNLGKGLGIGIAAWAKTGPLKAIFGPFVFLIVLLACFAWSVLDGIMSKLDGDNLKMAQSLESAFMQGGSASRLGYIQSKINPPEFAAAEKIEKAIESPATVLEAGETAMLRAAIDSGNTAVENELKQ